MRGCLDNLDRDPPRLIVGDAHTLDDLAAFALEEGIAVRPQQAIVSTASTLHPLMRERVSRSSVPASSTNTARARSAT